MTTATRVGGLQSFGECVKTSAVCRTLAEVRRVRFDYRKACRRLAEVWRVRFDHCKASMRLVELWRVGFK